ncbi:MAG: hypothetical protein HY774_23820 [Acidobacteria bacterium]|nr:hypothetical protein [Acidobacteriota bacterium]
MNHKSTLVILLILLLTGCTTEPPIELVPLKDGPPMPKAHEGIEARQWLTQHSTNSQMILNRFRTVEEAHKFVDRLYQAGADGVVIPYQYINQLKEASDKNSLETAEMAVVLPLDKTTANTVYQACLTEEPRAEIAPLIPCEGRSVVVIIWEKK